MSCTQEGRERFRASVNTVLGEGSVLDLGKQDSLRVSKCHVQVSESLQLAKKKIEMCPHNSSKTVCIGYKNIAALLDLASIEYPGYSIPSIPTR
jgi:hypothetical protein